MPDQIMIPRPHVPYGPDTLSANESDSQYLRDAARKLRDHYKPFGSNLRAIIVKLIEDAADQIERMNDE